MSAILRLSLTGFIRTETISTRYLCVSSSGASFPAWDWQAITGRSEKPFEDDQASSFIARTSAWDSFVIYAVDPSKAAFGQNTEDKAAKAPLGFPDPPPHALPVPACGPGLPIYYNQPVLLQCMNTGVVSPIMIIRRVDKGNLALGGGESDPQIVRPAFDLPSAPGEALGDAVSQ